ncbi:hypothetical protein HDV00_009465 [Rhizophlyctis rosea]|nr:hypothetical protein HDV00_009465 [Rhizophlyctis rosea]
MLTTNPKSKWPLLPPNFQHFYRNSTKNVSIRTKAKHSHRDADAEFLYPFELLLPQLGVLESYQLTASAASNDQIFLGISKMIGATTFKTHIHPALIQQGEMETPYRLPRRNDSRDLGNLIQEFKPSLFSVINFLEAELLRSTLQQHVNKALQEIYKRLDSKGYEVLEGGKSFWKRKEGEIEEVLRLCEFSTEVIVRHKIQEGAQRVHDALEKVEGNWGLQLISSIEESIQKAKRDRNFGSVGSG